MSEVQPEEKGKMLPGVAGISMFLLFFDILYVFAAVSNFYGPGRGKYSVLTLCTMLAVGLFGLLRMRRWGHAIVLAGCMLLAATAFFVFSRVSQIQYLVEGFFLLVFFLYLVRPEVRDRML